jgi:hypothetical protein
MNAPPAGDSGWLAHEPIGLPWSRNSTEPDGVNAPERLEATNAEYVSPAPILTAAFEKPSEIVVVSGETGSVYGALVEPAAFDPGSGVNSAVTEAGEEPAPNAVAQVAV